MKNTCLRLHITAVETTHDNKRNTCCFYLFIPLKEANARKRPLNGNWLSHGCSVSSSKILSWVSIEHHYRESFFLSEFNLRLSGLAYGQVFTQPTANSSYSHYTSEYFCQAKRQFKIESAKVCSHSKTRVGVDKSRERVHSG